MKALAIILSAMTLFSSLASAGPDDLEYFKQFIHTHEVDETDPENPTHSYRTVQSQWDRKLPLPNGDQLGFVINLYINADETFTAFYKELLYPAATPGQFRPQGCRRVEGKWSVPDNQLILPGLGYATRTRYLDQVAIQVHITAPLISNEVVNQTTPAVLGYSNFGIEQEFCF